MPSAASIDIRKSLLLGFVLLALSFIFSGLPFNPMQKQYEDYSGPTLQVECPVRQKSDLEGKGLPFSVIYVQEKGSGSCTGVSSSSMAVNPLALAINTAFWLVFSLLVVVFIKQRKNKQPASWIPIIGLSACLSLLVFALSYNLKPLSQPVYRDKIAECNAGNIEFCPYAINDTQYNANYEATSLERYDKGWPIAFDVSKSYNAPLNLGNLVLDLLIAFGFSVVAVFAMSGRLGRLGAEKDKRNAGLLVLSFVAGVISLPLAKGNAKGEFIDFVGPLLIAVASAATVGYVLITSRKPFTSTQQKRNFFAALVLAVPLGIIAIIALLYLFGIHLLFTS